MRKRAKKENSKKPLVAEVANILDIPQKVISNKAQIEMSGNNEIIIDGCQGVLEYSEELVKVASGSMVIKLTGTGFEIKCLSGNGIIIDGFIKTLEFIG